MKEKRDNSAFARKCSACGKRMHKSLLVRIVRLPSGEVILDKTGKSDGRGAYLCPDMDCFNKAVKTSRISKLLKVRIPDEVYEETGEYINERK